MTRLCEPPSDWTSNDARGQRLFVVWTCVWNWFDGHEDTIEQHVGAFLKVILEMMASCLDEVPSIFVREHVSSTLVTDLLTDFVTFCPGVYLEGGSSIEIIDSLGGWECDWWNLDVKKMKNVILENERLIGVPTEDSAVGEWDLEDAEFAPTGFLKRFLWC